MLETSALVPTWDGAVARLWLGVALSATSAVLWSVTESLCASVDFFKLFPGHMIWHVGMPLGLCNCLVCGLLLRADNFRQKPRFICPPGCLGRLYYVFFPGLMFVIEGDSETGTAHA